MAYLEDTRRGSAENLMDKPLKNNSPLFGRQWERWLMVWGMIITLMIWESGVHLRVISPLFFPPPSVILLTFIRLATNLELAFHAGTSLSRVFLGLILGSVPGLILGLIMGWSPRVYSLINPLIAAAHPVPKIAILPLIMILFGIGESSKVVVIAVTTFFPMLINTLAGVQQISPIHFEVAKNYGANLTKVFTRVILPGSLPMVLTGLRLALNMALLITTAVELVAAQEGLGALIWLSWQTLRTEELYVSLCVIAALGLMFNFLLHRLTRYCVPWQAENII